MAEFDPMVGKETQFKSGKEAAENGRKGGIASVEARRAKRSLRDRVKLFGELKVEGNIEASPAAYNGIMVIGTTGKGTEKIYGIRIE